MRNLRCANKNSWFSAILATPISRPPNLSRLYSEPHGREGGMV